MTKKTVGDIDNVVLHVRWELKGTESTTGTSGTFSGATPLDFDPSSVDEFVAYGDLTEELVIGWIQNVVVDSYWDHVTEQIKKKIDEVDDPKEEVSEQALPWASGSAYEPPTPVTGSGE